MTFLLFLIGVLLIGFTVRLLIYAVVLPRLQISAHLRQIEGYGFERAVAAVHLDARTRMNLAIGMTAQRLGRYMKERLPRLRPLRRGELTAAGYYEMSPDAVHGYRVIGACALPVLILLYLLATGAGFSLTSLGVLAGAAVGGWLLPALAVRHRGNARLSEIDRDLPELIDLLTATVEAGMGVAASLSLVANRATGALGDELRLTLQQQKLGVSNEQALNDMVERCDTPAVRAFVRSVNRADSMGVSIGPILRELATDVRRRRRHAAREKMMKAPVKMLFPLMFLIFPALMIELIYPAAYSLLHNLSGTI